MNRLLLCQRFGDDKKDKLVQGDPWSYSYHLLSLSTKFFGRSILFQRIEYDSNRRIRTVFSFIAWVISYLIYKNRIILIFVPATIFLMKRFFCITGDVYLAFCAADSKWYFRLVWPSTKFTDLFHSDIESSECSFTLSQWPLNRRFCLLSSNCIYHSSQNIPIFCTLAW